MHGTCLQVEEADCLVCVLLDEVESLTRARSAAVSGSEPADAIRAVNALLTQVIFAPWGPYHKGLAAQMRTCQRAAHAGVALGCSLGPCTQRGLQSLHWLCQKPLGTASCLCKTCGSSSLRGSGAGEGSWLHATPSRACTQVLRHVAGHQWQQAALHRDREKLPAQGGVAA